MFLFKVNLKQTNERNGMELNQKTFELNDLFREISCSIIFIIQNIQVYFDHCSTCINQRNGVLRRLFFDRTAFKEPLYLLLNNRYFFARVCSIPNITHWRNDQSYVF